LAADLLALAPELFTLTADLLTPVDDLLALADDLFTLTADLLTPVDDLLALADDLFTLTADLFELPTDFFTPDLCFFPVIYKWHYKIYDGFAFIILLVTARKVQGPFCQ
jgi:hypothetical protein